MNVSLYNEKYVTYIFVCSNLKSIFFMKNINEEAN